MSASPTDAFAQFAESESLRHHTDLVESAAEAYRASRIVLMSVVRMAAKDGLSAEFLAQHARISRGEIEEWVG